ncbi:MAG TPA: response regulator [Vicinamibacterales bacterium]
MPHTLLLADDSVTIQRVIELTFADEDIRVVAVSDGDQAIAAVDRNPPDIVLADVGMPGRTGYEVAQHIRATPRLAHIPVLLLTGAFEPVDQARAQEAGCDGVLAKPFEPQLVIGRVKELLTRTGGAPHAPAAVAAGAAAHDAAGAAPANPPNGGWPNPFSEPAPAASPLQPSDEVSSYFDRLDQAFASFSGTPAPAPPSSSPALDWFGGGKSEPTPAPDLPLSYGSPQSAFEVTSAFDAPVPAPPPIQVAPPPPPPPPAAPIQAFAEPMAAPIPAFAEAPAAAIPTFVEPPPAPRPVPPAAAAAPTFPPLDQAFEALLSAEQSTGSPAFAPAWPSAPEVPAAPAIDTDAIVAQVSSRVLEQLTDRVVRERVEAILSQIAERLIREEIEKIKERIK